MPDSTKTNWCLAVSVRYHVMAMAVVAPTAIIEVRRRDLRFSPEVQHTDRWAAAAVKELAADYEISTLVIEQNCPFQEAFEKTGLKRKVFSLEEVKAQVLNDFAASQGKLYEHLLAEQSKLGVLVRVIPHSGKIVMSARERNVQLNAVALGMAYQAARETRSIRFEHRAKADDSTSVSKHRSNNSDDEHQRVGH